MGGADLLNQRNNVFSPPELQNERNNALPGTAAVSNTQNLQGNVNLNAVHTWTPNASMSVTSQVGSQYELRTLDQTRTSAENLLGGLSVVTAGTVRDLDEMRQRVEDFGIFAQTEVLLNERLLLTLGARADRSSNNGDPGKFFFFPKASASYRFPDIVPGLLDELKLRAAYGETGNQPLYGQKFTPLELSNIDGLGGFRVGTVRGASDIRPERQREYEVGADATILGRRGTLELTGFVHDISDLLITRTLPPTAGYSSEISNGVAMRVWGTEAALDLFVLQRDKLQWQTRINWALNRSKITDLPVPAFLISSPQVGAVKIEEGKPATQIIGNDTLPEPGRKVVQVVMGDGNPDWTAGWSNTITYGPFTLYGLIDHQQGGMLADGTWRHYDLGQNSADYDDLTSTGQKIGDVRRTSYLQVTSIYYQDATFQASGADPEREPPGAHLEVRSLGDRQRTALPERPQSLHVDGLPRHRPRVLQLRSHRGPRCCTAQPGDRAVSTQPLFLAHPQPGLLTMTHIPTARLGRCARSAAIALALCAAAACNEVLIPNYNEPNVDQLEVNPTASTVNTTVLGLLVGLRAEANTYAPTLGILGREIYNLDAGEPRNVLAYLIGPLEPGGFGTDMGWTTAYRNLQTAAIALDATKRVTDYAPEEKEGVRGFVKTIMAFEYFNQIRVRDDFGIVVQINTDPKAPLAPFVSKDSALNYTAGLLDEAETHLQNAGGTFAFELTSGFAGFDTPATFLQVNRALKARLEAHRNDWDAALDALAGSFIDTTDASQAGIQRGVYHVYSTGSGDLSNTLYDPAPRALVALPEFLTEAQRRSDDSPDLRASSKAEVGSVLLSTQGVSSNVKITRYGSNTDPVPIIKNEELILLRTEANIGLENRGDAIRDLNFVRVHSGGLEPLPLDYAGDLVTELLYNRRYSLFFEYGHRWVDMRRYDRLDELPRAQPSHRVFPRVPIPVDECNQRSEQPVGCTQVSGS